MSLRTKMGWLLVLVLVLYAALDYAIQHFVVYRSFLELETEAARRDMGRSIEALEQEIHHLGLVVRDWAAWDDTYSFVHDLNPAYAESNLKLETFENLRLNLMYFFNERGEVVYGRTLDLETEEDLLLAEFPTQPWPPGHRLLAHSTVDGVVCGVVMTVQAPMIVASRPIVTTENKGPLRGSLIMGRLLTDAVVQTLAEHTRVDFHITPVGAGSFPEKEYPQSAGVAPEERIRIVEVSPKLLRASTVFPDLDGRPALIIHADIPRNIALRGRAAASYTLLSVLGAGLLMLLLVVLLTRRTVIDPLMELTQHVIAIGTTGDLAVPFSSSRRDELGSLANAFDRLLRHLASTRDKLAEQSYLAGMTAMAAEVLHNIRNALMPLTAGIERTRLDLQQVPVQHIKQAGEELAEGDITEECRKDLWQFVQLAREQIAPQIDRVQADLADVWEHIVAIERLLAEHDVWDRVGELIEPLHLDDLVRDASGRLHPAVRGNLTLEPDLSLSRLPPVSGYRPTLVKAITEILNNAAEAIQRAGQERGHVWVSAAVEPGDKGDMVHVKFLDDGYGIEAAHLGRIFEQDFSTKPEGRSHRGLHWCSNAVGAMKGRMYAESAGKGRGACIHLLLRTAGSPSDG